MLAGRFGLMLRCGTNGQAVAFTTYASDCVIADCTFLNHAGATVWPDSNNDVDAIRFAMLGTELDGGTGHLIRNSISKCLLAENLFGHTYITAIKLNGRLLP